MFELLRPLTAIEELIEGGGPFVFWIVLNGVIMWTLCLERYWYFSRMLPKEADVLYQQWNARADHVSWCAQQIRLAMVSRLNSSMNANMPILKVMVPLAPLLGLIGTVSGMLEVFDSMALRGSADARTMADGVSHAMICTMSGLAVSITGIAPLYRFQHKAKAETEAFLDRLTF